MAKLLKPGDKIAVYRVTNEKYDLRETLERLTGYIMNITESGVIEFLVEDTPVIGSAHPKQCRKIKQ